MTSPPAAFRLPPAACLLAVALVLGASGCGEENTGATGYGGERQPPATTDTAPKAGSPAAGCPGQLAALADSLAGLRRRLAIGLSYRQYVAEVRSLRATYREIPVDRLTFDCLATGRPSERALNKHIDAANSWGECLADAACTTQAIEPVLQRKWRVASQYLSQAR